MTDEDKILLKELKANAERLFLVFNEKKREVEKLKSDMENLHLELDGLRKEKFDLEQKNDKLVLANQILSGSDEGRDARKKIHKIVREIDKCIALLNK